MQLRSIVYRSFIIMSLGLLIVLASCGPASDLDLDVGPEEVSLGAGENDGQVEVEAGQILVLTLESNPTTGYRWEVVEVKDSVLQQMGEAKFRMASELDLPPLGAGGGEVFRFEAVESGETLLRLVYHRPWEEGVEPLETYSIQVVVR